MEMTPIAYDLGPPPFINGKSTKDYLDQFPVGNSSNVRIEYRSKNKWAICRVGMCLTKQMEWEYESIPSSRTDEFLEIARYDSLSEARDVYEEWKLKAEGLNVEYVIYYWLKTNTASGGSTHCDSILDVYKELKTLDKFEVRIEKIANNEKTRYAYIENKLKEIDKANAWFSIDQFLKLTKDLEDCVDFQYIPKLKDTRIELYHLINDIIEGMNIYEIIEDRDLTKYTSNNFVKVLEYIRDYLSINQFLIKDSKNV